jgi:hypothetical protein
VLVPAEHVDQFSPSSLSLQPTCCEQRWTRWAKPQRWSIKDWAEKSLGLATDHFGFSIGLPVGPPATCRSCEGVRSCIGAGARGAR